MRDDICSLCPSPYDFQSYLLPGWGYLAHYGQSTEGGV